ncbi:MAG: hypothetical protein SFV32_09185 [Opitutaceae bacterium]|nr:hypothetical protein [Opitutaceae bacterium]
MATLRKDQIRGIVVATAVALAIYIGFRLLPTGTNLSHLDFRPGGTSVEMCDPSNPQFIPVVTVKSPVALTVSPVKVEQGRAQRLVFKLEAASGKPVGPEDLVVTHTQKLHLLVISPDLEDYQHLHPQPGAEPGVWETEFTPRREGEYRIFADFTPVATGRGLYGFAAIEAHPAPGAASQRAEREDAVQVRLAAGPEGIRVNRRASLTLQFSGRDGAPVTLEPVMDAYAHLVAFDPGRLGYAHLHPQTQEAATQANPQATLPFEVTFPKSGPYVVWAQFKVDGREQFRRFDIEVTP